MKRDLPIILVCLAVFLSSGCRGETDRSPVIATVDGQEIRRSQFEKFLANKIGEIAGSGNADLIRSRLLDEFIQRKVVLAAASANGLTVSDSDIEQATVENPQLKSAIAAADSREELLADLLVEKYYRLIVLRDVRVSPEELRQYIEENRDRLKERPGFYLREIRVATREEAERLRAEVTEGHRDFAAVARVHSEAPNAPNGGLTYYNEGQLPAVLDRAVKPLRPGDISPVVESSYGFHIFQLERRTQPGASDDRRSQADDRETLFAEELIARKNQLAVNNAVNQLISETEIVIHDSDLGFTYSGNLRHN